MDEEILVLVAISRPSTLILPTQQQRLFQLRLTVDCPLDNHVGS